MAKCKFCGNEKIEEICEECGLTDKVNNEVNKQVVNGEIKVDIDGDGNPDITIKKTRFYKKGKNNG